MDLTHTALFRTLPDQLEGIPDVVFEPVSLDAWAALPGIPPLDRAVGWTHIEVGAPASDDPEDGYHMVVWFCPELMARTTEDLPISDDPLTEDLQLGPATGSGDEVDITPLLFADNYLRVVAMVLLHEMCFTAPGEEVTAHQAAIDHLESITADGKVVPLGLLLDTIRAHALDLAAA